MSDIGLPILSDIFGYLPVSAVSTVVLFKFCFVEPRKYWLSIPDNFKFN